MSTLVKKIFKIFFTITFTRFEVVLGITYTTLLTLSDGEEGILIPLVGENDTSPDGINADLIPRHLSQCARTHALMSTHIVEVRASTIRVTTLQLTSLTRIPHNTCLT